MSGSCGDYRGGVYLAHAWVPEEAVRRTVGPWQWWNVYQDAKTAAMQATRRAMYDGWKGEAQWEVLFLDNMLGVTHVAGGSR